MIILIAPSLPVRCGDVDLGDFIRLANEAPTLRFLVIGGYAVPWQPTGTPERLSMWIFWCDNRTGKRGSNGLG